MKIPFNRPFITGNEQAKILEVLNSRHLSGDGEFTEKCHNWLEKSLGCPKALLTHSGTAALEMAAMLCNISPGDEIIMPSFTFVSTANAFVLRGGIPVFIDIRPDTLNMDERLIENAITPETKAVVPVHYGGISCAMEDILDLSDRYNLFVIEDAAHAILSMDDKERYLGTIGHLGALSFHETKNIISGEGGALLINDPALMEQADIIRDKGTDRAKFFRNEVDKYTWVGLGSSYLPPEIMAAFLWAQFQNSMEIIEKRRKIFLRYYNLLSPLAGQGYFCLPYFNDDLAVPCHMFYIITRSMKERTSLMRYLDERQIKAVFHYVPLHSSPAGKKYGRYEGHMTVSNTISDRLLRLPFYNELTDRDIERVVDALFTFFKKQNLKTKS